MHELNALVDWLWQRYPELNRSSATEQSGTSSALRNLISRFFSSLKDDGIPFTLTGHNQDDLNAVAAFLQKGRERIERELQAKKGETEFVRRLTRLQQVLQNDADQSLIGRALWEFFFPEGAPLLDKESWPQEIERLRDRRSITIEQENPEPVRHPAREILFTSNVLITVPLEKEWNNIQVSEEIRQRLAELKNEEQKYWYDHPIPIGIDNDKNEAVYGLRGLNEMMAFEKERGTVEPGQKLTVLLSVSSTHAGLHGLATDYLREVFEKMPPMPHLDVYLISEQECEQLFESVLKPIAHRYFDDKDINALRDVFGVDGHYGRHYSLLKAVAALWQTFIDQQIRATFKIDLDQVFPQNELVNETGLSALQHFQNPKWGATGRDHQGNVVKLDMIAGALVNESDIGRALFSPDVRFPQSLHLQYDELVFFSPLPQALSTAAEMMSRHAIQRVHVTGGTNGILVEALRRYRPFTPTFIGRAEDQAYLMSVLFEGPPFLRYLHQPGLIMRHDKHTFAREVIKAAEAGKKIGDLVRLVYFSAYARALNCNFQKLKEQLDPFTGCFVSEIPVTLVYLRLTLQAARYLNFGQEPEAMQLMKIGSTRLEEAIASLEQDAGGLSRQYQREKAAWDLYYEILDLVEEQRHNQDAFWLQIRGEAKKVFKLH